MQSFKQQMQTEFIPRLKEMVEREKEHIEFIKKAERRSVSMVVTFIRQTAEARLAALKRSLKEYIEYEEKLS